MADNFTGHEPRCCGEHRTVGPHRAWCHDCGQWCSPAAPCWGCEPPGAISCWPGEANVEGERVRIVQPVNAAGNDETAWLNEGDQWLEWRHDDGNGGCVPLYRTAPIEAEP